MYAFPLIVFRQSTHEVLSYPEQAIFIFLERLIESTTLLVLSRSVGSVADTQSVDLGFKLGSGCHTLRHMGL